MTVQISQAWKTLSETIMGPKQLSFPVSIYLMQLFPAELKDRSVQIFER